MARRNAKKQAIIKAVNFMAGKTRLPKWRSRIWYYLERQWVRRTTETASSRTCIVGRRRATAVGTTHARAGARPRCDRVRERLHARPRRRQRLETRVKGKERQKRYFFLFRSFPSFSFHIGEQQGETTHNLKRFLHECIHF